MIETGLFVRPCPACKNTLEIKLSPEKDDISIFGGAPGKPMMPKSQAEAHPSPDVAEIQKQATLGRKCALCFTPAIYGGVLCNQHNFCGSCERAFPDGKPYQLKDHPRCQECAE